MVFFAAGGLTFGAGLLDCLEDKVGEGSGSDPKLGLGLGP